MATSTKSPGRKRRSPQNVHDIGNVGRMTGVTLEPRDRDEFGLETTEGLFSPTPAKKTAARNTNGTSTFSSEPMDVAESSAPEPIDILSSRKQKRNGKSILPLPRSRSPIKTNLGATPRRGSSVGAASPSRGKSPYKASSQPPVSYKRKLDFSVTELRGTPGSSRKSPKLSHNSARSARLSAYDLPRSSPLRDVELSNVDEADDIEDTQIPDGEDYNNGPIMEEDDYPETTELDQDAEANDQLETEADEALTRGSSKKARTTKNARGRRSSSKLLETQVADEDNVESTYPEVDIPEEDGEVDTGRESDVELEAAPELEVEEAEASQPPSKKRRGRPPRSAPTQTSRALAPKTSNSKVKPNKRGGSSKTASAVPASSQSNSFRPPPSPGSTTNTMARQRTRHQTPMEEDGVSHTRSGRNIYKPLEFWRGERAIFTENMRDANLQEIIRIEDVTPVKRSFRSNASYRKTKNRKPSVFIDEVEDDGPETWETEEGIISAPVRMWDSEQMISNPEDEEEQQLAFASGRMQPRAAVDNPNFMFTKTLTMPFFGSGVIELPAGGMKGLKNSRKFQFVFFMHVGKVAVEVAGTRFVISKGGMWQVPRGNFYKITNESDYAAKIFFAQSCEVAVEPREPPSLQNLADR